MFIRFPSLEIAAMPAPGSLRNLAQEIGQIGELALTDIGDDFVSLYQQEIAAVGAVDSGDFMNTVKVRRQAWHQRDIASGVAYSGVVEEGWTKRARGQESYPGRFPAKRAIARMGPIIQSAFNNQLMR